MLATLDKENISLNQANIAANGKVNKQGSNFQPFVETLGRDDIKAPSKKVQVPHQLSDASCSIPLMVTFHQKNENPIDSVDFEDVQSTQAQWDEDEVEDGADDHVSCGGQSIVTEEGPLTDLGVCGSECEVVADEQIQVLKEGSEAMENFCAKKQLEQDARYKNELEHFMNASFEAILPIGAPNEKEEFECNQYDDALSLSFSELDYQNASVPEMLG